MFEEWPWLQILNKADRSANQVKLVSTQLNMIHAKKKNWNAVLNITSEAEPYRSIEQFFSLLSKLMRIYFLPHLQGKWYTHEFPRVCKGLQLSFRFTNESKTQM